jgi:hypothetical protein
MQFDCRTTPILDPQFNPDPPGRSHHTGKHADSSGTPRNSRSTGCAGEAILSQCGDPCPDRRADRPHSGRLFHYNQPTLRNDAITTLASDSKELATILQQYPGYKLKIEGYCDERGSAGYNVALGDT